MEYRIGQIATISKTVSDKDVKQFAKLVGDKNPIHIDISNLLHFSGDPEGRQFFDRDNGNKPAQL